MADKGDVVLCRVDWVIDKEQAAECAKAIEEVLEKRRAAKTASCSSGSEKLVPAD